MDWLLLLERLNEKLTRIGGFKFTVAAVYITFGPAILYLIAVGALQGIEIVIAVGLLLLSTGLLWFLLKVTGKVFQSNQDRKQNPKGTGLPPDPAGIEGLLKEIDDHLTKRRRQKR